MSDQSKLSAGQRHTCMPSVGNQLEKYTINNENIQSNTEENRKVLFSERKLCFDHRNSRNILDMEEKLCLRWNDFETNVVSSFKELRDDKDFTNVILASEDCVLEAHQWILKSCRK